MSIIADTSINRQAVETDRASDSAELPLTIIEPRSGWQWINLKELWRFRELLMILAWRDIKVRYKQTVLGVMWAVLQPLAMVVVCSLIFGRWMGGPQDGVPYPLFVFAGFLPWFYFSNTITAAAQSVVGNQSLVTKVYFPRLAIPIASSGPYVLDFLAGFVILLAVSVAYGVPISWRILLMPVFFAGLAVTALGVGVLLAALTVAYRDFRHIVPFLIQLWMLATPSIYVRADGAIGPTGLALFPFNPAYGLIDAFRTSMLGGTFNVYSLTVSSAVGLICLLVGCFYFRRVERGFSDLI